MKFRFVALDLDGTLLNNNHELSERTKNVLRSLSKNGVMIAIATGRSVKNIAKYLEELDLPQAFVPTVLYNGAYGFKFVKEGNEWKKVELFGFPLPTSQSDAVLDFAQKYGCVAQVSSFIHPENSLFLIILIMISITMVRQEIFLLFQILKTITTY